MTAAFAPARPHLCVPLTGDAAACPSCGAPLAQDQGWCLTCGAAARTRLAPTPGWRLPMLVMALVVALSIGAIVFSAVRLSGSSTRKVTRTVTAATQSP